MENMISAISVAAINHLGNILLELVRGFNTRRNYANKIKQDMEAARRKTEEKEDLESQIVSPKP